MHACRCYNTWQGIFACEFSGTNAKFPSSFISELIMPWHRITRASLGRHMSTYQFPPWLEINHSPHVACSLRGWTQRGCNPLVLPSLATHVSPPITSNSPSFTSHRNLILRVLVSPTQPEADKIHHKSPPRLEILSVGFPFEWWQKERRDMQLTRRAPLGSCNCTSSNPYLVRCWLAIFLYQGHTHPSGQSWSALR